MVDEQHGKGILKKAEGAIKDTVGKVTGNENLQAEGKADKVEGSGRQAVGDVKDAGRNVADAVKR
jgi:uncharacterized protein YjbJ (UPF0337 family)